MRTAPSEVVVPVRAQLVVALGAPGDLDAVALTPAPRRAPGAGEIEVEVEASALNFKDALLALGMLGDAPAGAFGAECAGRVVAVGEGVARHRVGDRVVALGRGCHARYAVVPAHLAVRAPGGLDPVEAVTLPTALTTADHALHALGHLRATDSVLIHAAAGGVGLAALQLARRAGATVYATAGSEEKRALVRGFGAVAVMDSRSLDFADELLRLTGGRGVDVVLNSLGGAFIARGLSVLAPGGRMVELGVRDVLADTPLGMGLFRRGVSLCVMSDRAELPGLDTRLEALLALVERGELAPLPHRVFAAAAAGDALALMAGARHVGKLVLDWRAEPRASGGLVVPPSFARVCARAPVATTPSAPGITPDEGAELFERAIASGWAQFIVSTHGPDPRARTPEMSASPTRATHPRPALSSDFVAPQGPIEVALAEHWRDALGLDAVGVHDDFFALGGDSLLAVQVLARARRELGVDLPAHSLIEHPTVAALCARLAPAPSKPETVVTLREGDGAAPLFLLHPVGGQVYLYRDLVARLPPAQTVHGVRARRPGDDLRDWTLPALATAYLRDLVAVQPRGPYRLGGSSFGGTLAYEMACQLVARGERVALLAMIDAPGPGCLPSLFEDDASILGYLLCQRRPEEAELARLRSLPPDALIEHFLTSASQGPVHAGSVDEVRSLLRVWRANQQALWSYAPPPYPGRALFFAAGEDDGVNVVRPERAWRPLVRGGLDLRAVTGTHITMNQPPHVDAIAAAIADALLHP